MNNYISTLTDRMIKEGYETDYIKTVVGYSERLMQKDLPVIFDLAHLALYLDESEETLSEMVNNSTSFYSKAKIKSKKGKVRNIYIPYEKLKKIQIWILYKILYKVETPKCVKGFKLGSSIVDNAIPHVNKNYVLNLDFKNFFETIKEKQIITVFTSLGYNKIVSSALSKICNYNGSLPQGSPSSPYLSNLVCRNLDNKIIELIKFEDVTYTRYADDLTFSSNQKLDSLIPLLEELIVSEKFKINESKTRMQLKNQRQLVTGLVVNSQVSVPRKYIRELRSEIYYCKKYGVSGHMDRKGILYSNYKLHLYGKALYIKMVDKSKGESFLKELDKINWQY
ncbi:RNA-directed DNA polymerase [Sporosarcina sp. resist]|uniref:retron St85 family RNA-directed DNA polymerase n=1 Tax=Sporosarcina sp. resist TaxID=2762563 RepID=UPI00164E44C5|nr:retron St85 family RNA-directed DNA polymerase [Sporosarcina sp. resist]QNK88341.1 RNA-directed DNA polymerase [Sporosarcina sp. resist]